MGMRAKCGENKTCKICENKFYVKRVHLMRGWGVYCSRKCLGVGKRGIMPSNIEYARSRSPIKKGNKLASKNVGERHWNWQKTNPSYRAVHAWLRKTHGNATKCENPNCVYPRKDARGKLMEKPRQYQWANISGRYERDINDFKQLCPSCHKLFDLNKLKYKYD